MCKPPLIKETYRGNLCANPGTPTKWSCRLMVRSTPFQGVDAGSIPVGTTKFGNDVTQVVTLVCKTRAFGRCEFESRHSHNKGERQRWRVGLVCKTSGLRLSGFDSHLSHKNEKRLGRLKKITYLCKRIKNGPLVKRLTRYPFTVEARVRTPYGLQ